jgi:hypothetical protein
VGRRGSCARARDRDDSNNRSLSSTGAGHKHGYDDARNTAIMIAMVERYPHDFEATP